MKRWMLIAIAGLAFLVVCLSIANALLWTQREDKQNQVATLATKVAAQQTYIDGQVKAARLAESLKKTTAQQQCRAAIGGTKLVNGVMLQIRGSLLDLASAVIRPEVKVTLRARAKTFKTFPKPKCDPGPPPKPKARIGG